MDDSGERAGGKPPALPTDYIAQITGGGAAHDANCMDSANGVVTLSNILGCSLKNMKLTNNIRTNQISAITDRAWATTGWGWHAVGWGGADADTGRVFDACLKLDNDADPVDQGGTPARRTPVIPCNMVFKTTGAGEGASIEHFVFGATNVGEGSVGPFVTDAILTRISSWTVTYDGAAKKWIVKETRLGVDTEHTAKAECDTAYISDGDTDPSKGKVGFTISWPVTLHPSATPAGAR